MNSQLSSLDLLRGFVPYELSNLVFSIIGNRTATNKLFNKILFKTQDRAYKFIWVPRCQDIIEWEKSKYITSVAKHAKAPYRPIISTSQRNKV